jgi:outer membrane protein OmpA-like peptidoglycan-associated protein
MQVLVNGVPAAGVTVIPNRASDGLQVIGPDFGLDAWTLTTTRRPIPLGPGPVLIAEVTGWIDVSARGYAASTPLRAYLARRSTAPRGLQPGLRAGMGPAMDVIYLGEATVTTTGSFATSYPVPTGTAIGDYVLQLNGITNDKQVRSVNLAAKILPKRITRTAIRRGCLFALHSAKLTRSCERSLRAASQRIPAGASGTRIVVIGVSIHETSRAKNRYLAKKRARAVVYYLRAIGVRGQVVRRVVVVRGKGRGPTASQSVVIRRGVPRTTAIISFNR